MSIEDFYESRYVKISMTMRDIDSIAAALADTLATSRFFPGIDDRIHALARAAKHKCETLRIDPDIFSIWPGFVVACERLTDFPEPQAVNNSKADRREYAIDLSHRAIRVLQFVAFRQDPPRIDDVTAFLGCAPSTASELVKRLQKRGLVVRHRSASDERVVHIELTEAGWTALTEHTSVDPAKLESGLETLSVKEQKELIRLIGALTQRLRLRCSK